MGGSIAHLPFKLPRAIRLDTALRTINPYGMKPARQLKGREVTYLDDSATYHEMSIGSHDPDQYNDPALKEKIRRLEQLEIRPAVTVYIDTEE